MTLKIIRDEILYLEKILKCSNESEIRNMINNRLKYLYGTLEKAKEGIR